MKYVNADETSIVKDGLNSFGLYEYFNPCMRRDTGWHILIQSTVRMLYRYNVPITAPNVHGVMKQLGFACSAAAIRWQLQGMENRSLLHECYINERKQLGLTGLVTAATRVYTMTEHGIRTCKCIEHINEMYYIDLTDIARRLLQSERAKSNVVSNQKCGQLDLSLDEEKELSSFDDFYYMTFAEVSDKFPKDVHDLHLVRIANDTNAGFPITLFVEFACANLRAHDVVISAANILAFFAHYNLKNYEQSHILSTMQVLDVQGLIVEMREYPEDVETTLFVTKQEDAGDTPVWRLPVNQNVKTRLLQLLDPNSLDSSVHSDLMEARKQMYNMRQTLNQYLTTIDQTLARIETALLTSEA